MDPYNQQQYPPYNFQQTTAGPPQPPWQAPARRTGWGDPRPSQQHQPVNSLQSPVSPYNPSAFGNLPPPPPPPPPPGSYSPAPPSYPSDTSSWGVKYNQGQQQDLQDRPALPPRPTSASGNASARPETPVHSNYWQQDGRASISTFSPHHQSQTSWSDPHQPRPSSLQSPIPPPPPPRPPEYQNEIHAQIQYQQSTVPHEQYSHQAPSHHYDPQVQQNYSTAPGIQQYDTLYNPNLHSTNQPQHTYQQTGFVSPIEHDPQNWANPQFSSAHYGDGNVPAFIPPHQPENDRLQASALGSGGPSDWEHLGQGDNIEPVSPPETHATLNRVKKDDSQPPPSTPPLPSSEPISKDDQSAWLRRKDSEASSLHIEGIRRTGTIDSVINAWSSPLKVAGKTESEGDSRPKSRGSSHGRSPTRERIVEVTKVVDPYEDLEPEFKASLKRYVAMLRKEAAAETDEDKFDVFQTFVSKELRLRSMLYGIEAQPPTARKASQIAGAESLQIGGVQSTDKNVTIPSLRIEDIPNPAQKLSAVVPIAEQLSPEAKLPPWKELAFRPKAPEAARPNDIILHSPPPPPPTPTPAPVVVPTVPSSVDSTIKTEQSQPPIVGQISDMPVKYAIGRANDPAPNGDSQITKLTIATDLQKPENNTGEDAEYSPGGRPLIPKPQPVVKNKIERRASKPDPTLQASATSPSNNAPVVLQDYVMPDPPSPGRNAPILIEGGQPMPVRRRTTSPSISGIDSFPVEDENRSGPVSATSNAIKFEPARPAYTPFRYNLLESAPILPADKSYSSLRKDAVESGRLLVHEPTTPADVTVPASLRPKSTIGTKPHDEAFIGLIRQQSVAARKKDSDLLRGAPQLRAGTPIAQVPGQSVTNSLQTPDALNTKKTNIINRAPTPYSQPVQEKNVSQVTQALRDLLPNSVPTAGSPLRPHTKISNLKTRIDDIPDQFGFIHEAVVAWDRSNREVRRKQDEERHVRQTESEAHIDDLFNSNEIGYADIGGLEAEFKLGEANRKYAEDQAELDSFTRGVYQPVTERIQGEIADLMKLYTLALDMLDLESKAASRTIQRPLTSQTSSPTRGDPEGKVDMAFNMTLLLTLFSKLELRHLKIAEANVERERRRKRLELTVLYTNGDTAGVKKLEADFTAAEKMAVLQEARNKDVRANKLMDSFDRACVKGLGDNQYFVDEILAMVKDIHQLVSQGKTEKVLGDQTDNKSTNIPSDTRATLLIAQQAIDFVLSDSRHVMTLSNTADRILNDADYAVSLAEARVSNADAAMYTKLQTEKTKEDAKILEDTSTRLASIATSPEEALVLIGEILGQTVETGEDGERAGRMKKALEMAKARNKGSDLVDVPLT